jgi:excisionase family DNA binding protein
MQRREGDAMTDSLAGLSGYVTVKEAARQLGVSVWQVRYYLKQRRIPTVRVGFTVLLRLRDMDGLQK